MTGGSSGLGLALSINLTKKGAHVSIVARTESKLKSALEELEVRVEQNIICQNSALILCATLIQTARQSPSQILKYYVCSLDDAKDASSTLDSACEPHNGRTPDVLFLCAGSSKPGFFVEETAESMRAQMDGVYWVSANTALVR